MRLWSRCTKRNRPASSAGLITLLLLSFPWIFHAVDGMAEGTLDHIIRSQESFNGGTNRSFSASGRSLRRKRDFGIASGSVSYAILTGVIGMTAKAVSDLTSFQVRQSEGGCEWFGQAPFCNPSCPSGFDFIRAHNGRCSNYWFTRSCVPDDSFGEPCSTVLGSTFEKKFCCKSDKNECTWSGRWIGAYTAHNAYCRYDNSVGRCGQLSCSINHYNHKALDRTLINGSTCDQLSLFNLTGIATCGYIFWMDSNREFVNSWYKAT